MDIPAFTLGEELTPEQAAFLDTHGFIRFSGFASPDEVRSLRAEAEMIEARWIQEGREKAYGIPIKYGVDEEGRRFVNRAPFTSQYSDVIHRFVNDPRFERVRRICGPEFRLGEREKDGVVINHYRNCKDSAYRQLGWHVDGLRDIFYLRLPKRFLNVGFYLTDSSKANGCLHVIPGSHKQGAFGFVFGKLHFLNNGSDPREVAVEAKAGDLTLHDGRLWHRVSRAAASGEASRRMNMYMPFLSDAPQPKTEKSRTPLYHYLQRLVG